MSCVNSVDLGSCNMYSRDVTFFHSASLVVGGLCLGVSVCDWLQIVTYRKSLETVLNTTVTVFSRI